MSPSLQGGWPRQPFGLCWMECGDPRSFTVCNDQRYFGLSHSGRVPERKISCIPKILRLPIDVHRQTESVTWTNSRFDPSGDDYDVAVAGDRLVDGVYEPMEVEQVCEDVWHGYSEPRGLHVCWEHGSPRFFDSMTESYLLSHREEVDRADAEAVETQKLTSLVVDFPAFRTGPLGVFTMLRRGFRGGASGGRRPFSGRSRAADRSGGRSRSSSRSASSRSSAVGVVAYSIYNSRG